MAKSWKTTTRVPGDAGKAHRSMKAAYEYIGEQQNQAEILRPAARHIAIWFKDSSDGRWQAYDSVELQVKS